MAKISVVVPVYKVELYLRQCIDSILEQTFSDFELILVDDGSPDDCGEICDEYVTRDGRIKVIHQENRGLSEARNAGIKAAEGEYITFIDSDDFVDSHYLEYLYKGIVDNYADISICDYFSFFDEQEIPDNVKNVGYEIISGREACIKMHDDNGGGIFAIACCKLYRKKSFNDIIFPSGKIHEDTFTTYKLLYPSKRIALCHSKTYFYRISPESITRRKITMGRYDVAEALKNQVNFFEGRNDLELKKKAEKSLLIQCAALRIRAKHDDALDVIPDDYKMSEYEAMKILYKNLSQQNYEWYLSLNHPNLVAHHERLMKIKSIFKNIFKK